MVGGGVVALAVEVLTTMVVGSMFEIAGGPVVVGLGEVLI